MKLILQNDRIAATATDDYTGPDPWMPAPEGFDPGRMELYRVVDGQLAATVPQQVTRAQGKAVLIQMGLWSQVLSVVDGIADPVQKALAEVALHDTQFWQRSSPFLNQAAQALGMTQAQLDDLFIAASEVVL